MLQHSGQQRHLHPRQNPQQRRRSQQPRPQPRPRDKQRKQAQGQQGDRRGHRQLHAHKRPQQLRSPGRISLRLGSHKLTEIGSHPHRGQKPPDRHPVGQGMVAHQITGQTPQ